MSASNSNGIAKSSKAKTTNAGSSGTPTQEAPTDTVMEDLSSGPLLLLPKGITQFTVDSFNKVVSSTLVQLAHQSVPIGQ
ncbi:hypothetical protein L5515_001970 [Caenorhabditis briggsae]|uniref:Uncharacterized protein n=1 Tax=Caenorhabditis briggsae TaxID=6238 RepID=A0AAE9DXK5_CAEBR|nr:hypothetical protein L3Y34_015898 [Caenorhabditis briggsae]UMM13937.1 hypothetical protein L5515_001970 [Caenorhabditis briggsae]